MDKLLPLLPTSEVFKYGPSIGPFRVSTIVFCVFVIVTLVVVESYFANTAKDTFKPPPGDKMYQSKMYE